MINISIKRSKQDNNLMGFSIKGHAGAGKHGEDIVCAAVSAIAYMAVSSLSKIEEIRNGSLFPENITYKSVGSGLNIDGCCEYTLKNGLVKCYLRKDISQEDQKSAQIILNTIYIGFKQIEESSEKYVNVCEEEV